MPGWPMSPAPWPLTRPAAACSRCSPTAPPRCPAPAGPPGPGWPPARPSPPPRPEPGAGRAASPRPRSAHPGSPCWPRAAPVPEPPGIFAYTGRTWHLAGPALPAAYAHQAITVLRLTTTSGTTTALLAAGTGPAARLLAGWSADGGAHWALSPPLPLNGATLTSASSGPGGSLAIVLSRPPRSGHHQRRGHLAAAARAAARHRDARTGSLRRMGRPGRPQHPAHRLAARARRPAWATRPGHQGSHPVRLIRVSGRQTSARTRDGALPPATSRLPCPRSTGDGPMSRAARARQPNAREPTGAQHGMPNLPLGRRPCLPGADHDTWSRRRGG